MLMHRSGPAARGRAGVLVACAVVTGIGRPRRGGWLAALALLAMPSHARGAEGEASAADRLELTWSAVEGCPSEADVLAEVRKLLGERAGAAEEAREGAPIRVEAKVLREAEGGPGFVVRLETPGEGATQVRELRGATCKAVADAAALIFALMIDPDAAIEEPQEAGEAAPASPPRELVKPRETTVSRVKQETQVPRPATESARSIKLRLGAWVGADFGSLPGLAPGFGALGSIALGAPRVSLGVAFWPDKAGSLEELPTAGGDVRLLTGELGVCAALLDRPLEIAPCVAVEVGQLHAEGFGVSELGEDAVVWAAFKGGGALAWRPFQPPLTGLGITARLDFVLPLTRPEFVLEGIGSVHQPSAVAGRGAVGVEVLF